MSCARLHLITSGVFLLFKCQLHYCKCSDSRASSWRTAVVWLLYQMVKFPSSILNICFDYSDYIAACSQHMSYWSRLRHQELDVLFLIEFKLLFASLSHFILLDIVLCMTLILTSRPVVAGVHSSALFMFSFFILHCQTKPGFIFNTTFQHPLDVIWHGWSLQGYGALFLPPNFLNISISYVHSSSCKSSWSLHSFIFSCSSLIKNCPFSTYIGTHLLLISSVKISQTIFIHFYNIMVWVTIQVIFLYMLLL